MPHAGTWIEMPPWPTTSGGRRSCLTQARGLKWEALVGAVHPHVVPHAGTWIEILPDCRPMTPAESCLTQARGLKF